MTYPDSQAITLRKPLCDSENFFQTIGSWEELPGPSRMVMAPRLVELTWSGLQGADANETRLVFLRADLAAQQVTVRTQLINRDDPQLCSNLRSISMSLRDVRWEAQIRKELQEQLG